MITVAVTGGIGTGKSAVTDHLTSLGYTVIDADKMSRELTAAGGSAMPYIAENFGPGYINEDGSLNRKAMKDLVFRDPEAKRLLEKGTTDVVLEDIRNIRKEKEAAGEKILFFDIPLLFETETQDNYDLIWSVVADRDKRIERIMKRDNITAELANLIIGTQTGDEVKITRSDAVFYNNGTIEDLHQAVDFELSRIM